MATMIAVTAKPRTLRVIQMMVVICIRSTTSRNRTITTRPRSTLQDLVVFIHARMEYSRNASSSRTMNTIIT